MAEEGIEIFNDIDALLKKLPIKILEQLSYESKLKTSMRRTLKCFDRESLIAELEDFADWLNMNELLDSIGIDHRIKSYASINEKHERYKDSLLQLSKVFNDVLGFRVFCESYEKFLGDKNSLFEIADMSKGKRNDDGYRAVHIYFQRRDGKYYPIEIQVYTLFDRKFNDWLHIYLYKNKKYPSEIGRRLRKKYESGLIKSKDDFEAALNDIMK